MYEFKTLNTSYDCHTLPTMVVNLFQPPMRFDWLYFRLFDLILNLLQGIWARDIVNAHIGTLQMQHYIS